MTTRPSDPGSVRTIPAAEGCERRAWILIVEADATHRHVACAMLEAMGHGVGIAGTGAEAAAALHTGAYDIVFMDMRLAEAGELAAALSVRSLSGSEAGPYIIALAGDASRGQAERCRAAGIDDLLTTPLVPEQIAGALARFFERAAPSPRRAVANRPVEAFDRRRIDLLVLELGAESVRQILDRFLDDTAARFVRLRGYGPDRERDEVGREIHSLTSAALCVGMNELARLARDFDSAGRAGKTYPERLDELEAAFRAAASLLRAIDLGPPPDEITVRV